jgi:leucine-zipper-like transcriptional regulator 1
MTIRSYFYLLLPIVITMSGCSKKTPSEIDPLQQVQLKTPNGGEIISIGSQFAITWSTQNITKVRIEFSANQGRWVLIDTVAAETGSYQWSVPVLPSSNGKIRISDFEDGSPSDSSDQIFAVNGQWTDLSGGGYWTPRNEHAALVFDNKIWVMGGSQTNWFSGPAYNDVWYSGNGIDWSQATPNAQWSPRFGHSVVVFDGKLWLLGGYTNNHDINDVWNSTDGITWQLVTSAAQWSGRSDFAALTFNGKMWVLGGRQLPNTVYNDVWYSSDGAQWQKVTDAIPWPARCYHAAVVYDSKMWIMGGGANSKATSIMNDVWSSPDGVNWLQPAQHAAWEPRWGHRTVVYDNKMWLFGGDDSINFGLDSTTRKNDMWYSTDGVNWDQAFATSPCAGRWGHSVAVLGQKIYIMGGYSGTVNNQVWAWP